MSMTNCTSEFRFLMTVAITGLSVLGLSSALIWEVSHLKNRYIVELFGGINLCYDIGRSGRIQFSVINRISVMDMMGDIRGYDLK